jgi:hypothetical protein
MRKSGNEPIDITIAGSPSDPREPLPNIPGVRVHRVPALHPDDRTVVDGLPVTSISRTLVDLAEVLPRDELREVFAEASEKGLLDMDAVEASYARVEWRPSLRMLRDVMDEFAS